MVAMLRSMGFGPVAALVGSRVLRWISREFRLARGAAEQHLAAGMNDPMRRIGRYRHSTYRIAHLGPSDCLVT
jgi:hypothetical protein